MRGARCATWRTFLHPLCAFTVHLTVPFSDDVGKMLFIARSGTLKLVPRGIYSAARFHQTSRTYVPTFDVFVPGNLMAMPVLCSSTSQATTTEPERLRRIESMRTYFRRKENNIRKILLPGGYLGCSETFGHSRNVEFSR